MVGESLRGRREKTARPLTSHRREHPVHGSLRRGLAAGGKAARDVEGAGGWRGEGAVAGRAAGR